MPVLIGDTDVTPKQRTLPGSQTIFDHFVHKEMGENKLDYYMALYRTARVFELSIKQVEDALIDISLLQSRGVNIH